MGFVKERLPFWRSFTIMVDCIQLWQELRGQMFLIVAITRRLLPVNWEVDEV
jgi:hypothetical protein